MPKFKKMSIAAVAEVEPSSDQEQNDEEELRVKIINLFRLFDADKDSSLEREEVGHVLRCLGFSLCQAELEALCDQLPKQDDVIPFENLYQRVISAFRYNEWPIPSEKKVHRAFQLVCEDRFIKKERLTHLLTTIGEPLSEAEAREVISHLKVKKDGNIDWREYEKQLIKRSGKD